MLNNFINNKTTLILFFAFLPILSKAQLCTGSLGDAVVNITFGNGGNANTDYTPTNAYTYTSSSCPNDGLYTITNTTSNCFGGSWHNVTNDHTGNGAFMLVNASYQPGDFMVTTVKDLCPNTTYEFAAWVMNVLKRSGIKPNITFTIESTNGTALQQFSTGDIPETFVPEWKQYGFFFNTPINNPEIVLRMTNNAPGGNGNDIGLDDITFKPCSNTTITAQIQGNTDTVGICDDDNNTYNFNGSITAGYTEPIFQWQLSIDSGKIWKDIPNANTINFVRNKTQAGAYWYRITVIEKSVASNIGCRIASKNLVINVHATPLVNAGSDRTIILGDAINLDGQVTGESPSYFWSPSNYLDDINTLNALSTPTQNITYILSASTPYGCSNWDTVSLKVLKGIFIPSVFTPNGDGKNDNWRIPAIDPLFGADVKVFNRFGQIVYRAKNTIVNWDGKFKGQPQEQGNYVYYISFKNRKSMKGTILLLK